MCVCVCVCVSAAWLYRGRTGTQRFVSILLRPAALGLTWTWTGPGPVLTLDQFRSRPESGASGEPNHNQNRSAPSSRSWTLDLVSPRPAPESCEFTWSRSSRGSCCQPCYASRYHGNITDKTGPSGHVVMLPWRRPHADWSGWCWRYFYLFIY